MRQQVQWDASGEFGEVPRERCGVDAPFASGRSRTTQCIGWGEHEWHQAADGSRWRTEHEIEV